MNEFKLFVISDSHFGHKNMVENGTIGLREAGYDDKIWAGLDSLPDDAILIHCGDITMGADMATHERLRKYPFKKWLIRGNHDGHSITWYVRNGWDFVGDELVLNILGSRILFTHAPTPKREGITKNIHGHLHGGKSRSRPSFYEDGYHVEVCPEVIGYMPAKLK